MKGLLLLLSAVLAVIISTEGKGANSLGTIGLLPMGQGRNSGRGSSCIIRSRSIDIDDDNREQSRQAMINNGGLFIPSAFGDEDQNDEYEDEEQQQQEDEEFSDTDGGEDFPYPYQGQFPGQYPYGPLPQYGPQFPYGQRYPMQYAGGIAPGFQDPYGPYAPSTSLSVSSEPNFGQSRPQSDEVVTIKRRPSGSSGGSGGSRGGNSKKRGNINCIIITRSGGKGSKGSGSGGQGEPFKLFGWLPFTRRRRSIANHLKSLKSQ